MTFSRLRVCALLIHSIPYRFSRVVERSRVDSREGSSGRRGLSIQTVYLTEDLGPYLTTKKYHNTVEESAPGAGVEVSDGIEYAEAWVETYGVRDTRGLRRDLKRRGKRSA
jgi:hypothetical protein